MPSACLPEQYKSLSPWVAEPHRLWSLLDMFGLRAAAFIELGQIAGLIRSDPRGSSAAPPAMTAKERAWFLEQVARLDTICQQLTLPTSAQLVARSLERLRTVQKLSWAAPRTEFAKLIEVIEVELSTKQFLIVAPERLQYWNSAVPSSIQLKFGSVVGDLTHASVCIALECDTASVFHSMRVLEKGLVALAMAVGAPHAFENWQNIIEQIESRVAAMKALPRSAQKVSDQQFYSEAAKEFMYFKDAWRNHVAHSRATYELEQAVKVLNHVRDFMEHLAGRLHD